MNTEPGHDTNFDGAKKKKTANFTIYRSTVYVIVDPLPFISGFCFPPPHMSCILLCMSCHTLPISSTFTLVVLLFCDSSMYVMLSAYRLKKRACNSTPSKIQTVPKNSNSVYSEHWSQAS